MTPEQRQLLESLARTCAERAWRIALVLLRDEHEAWDAVQQAFVVAARKPDKIPRDDAWPWFAQVVVFEARNLRRKRPRGPLAPAQGESMNHADADPTAALGRRERELRVEQELQGLPHAEREALVLVHCAGMSHAEAAQVLGRSRTSVTRAVQRGLERMSQRLGARPDFAAGSLALLPVIDPPGGLAAAAQAWTQVAAAHALVPTSAALAAGSTTLMASKPAVLLGFGLAAFVGFVGGGSTHGLGLFAQTSEGVHDPAGTAQVALSVESSSSSSPALSGVPLHEEIARLSAQRDGLQARLAAREHELDALRNGGITGQRGPTFTFGVGGALEAVHLADWPRLADASRRILDGMKQVQAALAAGEAPPREASLVVQENVERMRVYEFRVLGKLPTAARHNGEFTHPISLTNLMAALLHDSGQPLDDSQIEAIHRLGMVFDSDLRGILDGRGPRVRRLVAEYELKRRFVEDVHATLSESQRAVVVDPQTHRIAGLDLYDPTLMLIHTSPLLAAASEDAIVSSLESLLVQQWKLDEQERLRLAPILRTWRARIRPLLAPVPKHRVRHYSADLASAAGEATVELVEAALRDLELSPEVREALEQDPTIYMPRLLGPQSQQ